MGCEQLSKIFVSPKLNGVINVFVIVICLATELKVWKLVNTRYGMGVL